MPTEGESNRSYSISCGTVDDLEPILVQAADLIGQLGDPLYGRKSCASAPVIEQQSQFAALRESDLWLISTRLLLLTASGQLLGPSGNRPAAKTGWTRRK